jgi:hypothetical protein
MSDESVRLEKVRLYWRYSGADVDHAHGDQLLEFRNDKVVREAQLRHGTLAGARVASRLARGHSRRPARVTAYPKQTSLAVVVGVVR